MATISLRQLAERLGVTAQTIYNWRRSKVAPLPCVLEPSGQAHRVLLDEDKVNRWLKRHKPDLLRREAARMQRRALSAAPPQRVALD